jgi:GDPmannose 4,6-dehydratase
LKIAIIVGALGQDGRLLSVLLKEEGYQVIELDIDYIHSPKNLWKEHLDIKDKNKISHFIEKVKPDEVYYLAAYHHSSEQNIDIEYGLIEKSFQINVVSYFNFLEAIRTYSPRSKIFYAASSHIFGKPETVPQNEATKFSPKSIYSLTKYNGVKLSKYYRENYSVFSAIGIMYNHESPIRDYKFVSRKITSGLAKIKCNQMDSILLGNLEQKTDWGFAGDYVRAMKMILNNEKPDDYVIASGEHHSVKEFVEKSAKVLGIEIIWEGDGVNTFGKNKENGKIIIEVKPEYYRPIEVNVLLGDSSKAKKELNWSPKISFNQLVEMMTKSDLKIVRESINSSKNN